MPSRTITSLFTLSWWVSNAYRSAISPLSNWFLQFMRIVCKDFVYIVYCVDPIWPVFNSRKVTGWGQCQWSFCMALIVPFLFLFFFFFLVLLWLWKPVLIWWSLKLLAISVMTSVISSKFWWHSWILPTFPSNFEPVVQWNEYFFFLSFWRSLSEILTSSKQTILLLRLKCSARLE